MIEEKLLGIEESPDEVLVRFACKLLGFRLENRGDACGTTVSRGLSRLFPPTIIMDCA